ncbi:hypothetical protein PIB30_103934 [Stylosanthes scabra]|uniref:Uncharacterized protein n=1 Tax=Stylosanthes scabra TaxID=79078 RepID=A0ABU6W033_9FABA|nr:hypothetical protein [Stylosanthes scabra]
MAKESARNEKIAKKSLETKSRAYAYAPKGPMRTQCHDLGVTSKLEPDHIPLRARQPIDKAEPSNSAPVTPDPIVISSDSEEDREKDPKVSNSEEEDPEVDPEGENQEVNSTDESEELRTTQR